MKCPYCNQQYKIYYNFYPKAYERPDDLCMVDKRIKYKRLNTKYTPYIQTDNNLYSPVQELLEYKDQKEI